MREIIRSAFVIGKRDYRATVMSKTFLFFLLGPLFPIAVGVLFGTLGSELAESDEESVVAVLGSQEDVAALNAARERLAILAPMDGFLKLEHVEPAADMDAQREELLERTESPILGVFEGGLDAPVFTGAVGENGRTIRQLTAFVDDARRDIARQSDAVPTGPPIRFQSRDSSASSVDFARNLTARLGQVLIFFLTILLASMLLSQMIEEKSNKAIEVLASSVPVDGIFLGKLFAMLAISITGIVVWAAAIFAGLYIWGGMSFELLPPAPAVGWPMFLVLGLVYFTTTYLLLGASFLGIGAQASTVREVQTLSMPVTMFQVVIFLAAQMGIPDPQGTEAIAAAIFPLTSPLAMIARAAQEPTLWTHALAIVWQIAWIAIILKFSAKFFRKSVLKSGKPFRWPWAKKKASA